MTMGSGAFPWFWPFAQWNRVSWGQSDANEETFRQKTNLFLFQIWSSWLATGFSRLRLQALIRGLHTAKTKMIGAGADFSFAARANDVT